MLELPRRGTQPKSQCCKERAFLLEHKRNLGISDEVHSEILTELGWTESAWERGAPTTVSVQRPFTPF